MPELPEVETVRHGLEPVLAGAKIDRVEQRRADLRFAFPERFVERLTGQRIVNLGRRAKYLQARLSGGDVLVMHLGMSGRFTIAPLGEKSALLGEFTYDTGADPKHDHVVLHMGNGARVTYNDPRRFGFMLLIPEAEIEVHPLFAGLGPEPMGNALNAAYLAGRARDRKTDLKAFLLDQRTIAGLGNIYVCEALHRVGLSPLRSASILALKSGKPSLHAEPLVVAIREVLGAAIRAGGSTLKDYRAADGALGYFQHQFLVYGREGEPCLTPACRGTVHRSIQAGRSTFHCPVCQR
jgi:formamidopyrimidine-DNA glycosylase